MAKKVSHGMKYWLDLANCNDDQPSPDPPPVDPAPAGDVVVVKHTCPECGDHDQWRTDKGMVCPTCFLNRPYHAASERAPRMQTQSRPWPKPDTDALQRTVDAFLASGIVRPAPDNYVPIGLILEALRTFVADKGIAEAGGHISQEAFAAALDDALVDRKKVPYLVGLERT